MKRMLSVIFMLTFSIGSFSQTNQPDTTENSSIEKNMYTIRQNAVYNEDVFVFIYERLFPLNKKLALALNGGIMIFDPFLVPAEAAIVTGGPKNFLEAGTGALFNPFEGEGIFTLRAGYRYQAPKGFLLKLSAVYSPGNFIIPVIGVGYAF